MEPSTSPCDEGATSSGNDFQQVVGHAYKEAEKILKEYGVLPEVLSENCDSSATEIAKEIASRIMDMLAEMVPMQVEDNIQQDESDAEGAYNEVVPLTEGDASADTWSTASSDNEENYAPDIKKIRTDTVPWSIKVKAVTAAKLHPKWSWKTIRAKVTKQLTSSSQLGKWKTAVEKNGSLHDKFQMINEYTYNRFVEARAIKLQVTTRMLQQWALQAANQFLGGNFDFTASRSWVTKFKATYNIRQCRVTRFVSKRDTNFLDDTIKHNRTPKTQHKRKLKYAQEAGTR